jgi:hypothetical protein
MSEQSRRALPDNRPRPRRSACLVDAQPARFAWRHVRRCSATGRASGELDSTESERAHPFFPTPTYQKSILRILSVLSVLRAFAINIWATRGDPLPAWPAPRMRATESRAADGAPVDKASPGPSGTTIPNERARRRPVVRDVSSLSRERVFRPESVDTTPPVRLSLPDEFTPSRRERARAFRER